MDSNRSLYIPVILGTARIGRMSQHAAWLVTEELGKCTGVETDLIDIAKLPLPTNDAGEAIKQADFSAKMNKADALVVVSPEYNHGYSGLLKHVPVIPLPPNKGHRLFRSRGFLNMEPERTQRGVKRTPNRRGSSSTTRTLVCNGLTFPPYECRKREEECSACLSLTSHPDMPAVRDGRLFGDRESYPAARSPILRSGAAIEALENQLSFFRRDHGAVIVNCDPQLDHPAFRQRPLWENRPWNTSRR